MQSLITIHLAHARADELAAAGRRTRSIAPHAYELRSIRASRSLRRGRRDTTQAGT